MLCRACQKERWSDCVKRDEIRRLYPEEYDYLESIKRIAGTNQIGLRGPDEARTKNHLRLLKKYRYPVGKDSGLYLRSRVLMDNLDVMVDLDLNGRVTGEECRRLAEWLDSTEFRMYMEGKTKELRYKDRVYR